MDSWERTPRLGEGVATDPPGGYSERGLGVVAQVAALIERGDLFLAQDVAQRGMEVEPDNSRLRHLRALALAELGATSAARDLIGAADGGELPELRSGIAGGNVPSIEDVLGLIGRLHRDAWLSSKDRGDLVRARDAYFRAFEASADTYAGINAASTSWWLGDTERAAALAERVMDPAQRERRTSDALSVTDDYWLLVTVGEAALLLNQPGVASDCYEAAVARAGNRFRLLGASRRQLETLRRRRVKVPDTILASLASLRIVVFADRMIVPDSVDGVRVAPHAQEAVARAIRDALEEIDARIGYCSAAGGGDILFLEAMQARGG